MPAAKKTTARPRATARGRSTGTAPARGSPGARKAAESPPKSPPKSRAKGETTRAARGAAAVPRARGAAAPAAPALAQRRLNRKHVLDALNRETGSNGGDHAAPRVIAYRDDPEGAGREHFTFVGALPLVNWYVDPARPTAAEARSLWHEVRKRMAKPVGTPPAGIDSTTSVVGLQTLAEQMP